MRQLLVQYFNFWLATNNPAFIGHKQRQQVVEAGVKTHAVPARTEQEEAQAWKCLGFFGSAASGRSGGPLALVVRPLDSADVAQNPIPDPLKRQKIGRHGSASDGRIGDSPSDPEDMTHPTSQSPSKQDGVRHCRFVFEYVKDHAC